MPEMKQMQANNGDHSEIQLDAINPLGINFFFKKWLKSSLELVIIYIL